MATDAPARYNPKNVMLQPEDLRDLLTRFGVDAPYTDINIYRRAFVNRSYCTKKNENYVNGNVRCPPGCLPLQEESNERLEYLGDAILNKTIAMYIFHRFPKDNEGFLTVMRTKLVNGVQLAKFAKDLGMDRFVIISAQLEESGGRYELTGELPAALRDADRLADKLEADQLRLYDMVEYAKHDGDRKAFFNRYFGCA